MASDTQNGSPTDQGLQPAAWVLDRYKISEMTLHRWLQNDALAFPRPLVINRRRYFYEAELAAWERARAAGRAA